MEIYDSYELFSRCEKAYRNNLHNIEFNKKLNALKLDELNKNYIDAVSNFNTGFDKHCRYINSNLCVFSFQLQRWVYLDKNCFLNIEEDLKQKYYWDIKNCILNHIKAIKLEQKFYPQTKVPVTYHTPPVQFRKGTLPPIEATQFLYQLTEGNENKLEQFSILTASFLFDNYYAQNEPVVIFAKKSIHKSLIDYFNILFNWQCWHTNFYDLLKDESLKLLNSYSLYRNCRGIIVNDSEIPQTEPYLTKLKKIMYGRDLKIAGHSFGDKLSIINIIPIIYITDCRENLLTMKNLYRTKCITINSTEVNRLPYDVELISWFGNEFANLGFNWNNDKRQKHFTIPPIDDESAVNEFLEKICIFDENAECIKNELHEAYCLFFKKYFGPNPLTKTMFGKMVKKLKCDQLEETRPHKSKDYYPHCFKGVKINQEKYSELLETADTFEYKNEFEKFKDTLHKIITDSVTSESMVFDT